MMDIVQAILGWAITWLIILAFPTVGVSVANRVWPGTSWFQRVMGVAGFAAALWIINLMPDPPDHIYRWVAE